MRKSVRHPGALEEYGYVHEEHLARQLESRVLINMQALREKLGIADDAP